MSDVPFNAACVEGTLQPNLAFMPDSAAPHAIHKSNIIDQSSNSGLFQQTEREKKKPTDSNSPVVEELLLVFILTAILSH